jgi:hypothetical protein
MVVDFDTVGVVNLAQVAAAATTCVAFGTYTVVNYELRPSTTILCGVMYPGFR